MARGLLLGSLLTPCPWPLLFFGAFQTSVRSQPLTPNDFILEVIHLWWKHTSCLMVLTCACSYATRSLKVKGQLSLAPSLSVPSPQSLCGCGQLVFSSRHPLLVQ